jgi:two-component system, response regulator YesN
MLKVLIVDDMDIIRREIKRLKLWGEGSGFIIANEANNGQAALEVLEANSVDLVITDIRMSKVDGLELLQKIVERNLCSCVVLFSDYTEFAYARQGLVLGAFDYMTKPVKEEEFESLLQRAKKFILEKNKEQERVKNLEQRLGEKVEVFFPKHDVKQIIELIEEGDPKCLEVAIRMVHMTEANLGNDYLKLESVFKNVLLEIVKTIFENKKWLEKFIQPETFTNADFLQCKDISEISQVFTNTIERICKLINLLHYGKKSNDIVSQVSNCVLTSDDGDISLRAIAEKLFMNKTYISEAFKQKSGVSLVEYLTIVKMERAKRLLLDANLKTYEVGDKLGYKDVEYFSKLFKKYTGLPPTEFRQNHVM